MLNPFNSSVICLVLLTAVDIDNFVELYAYWLYLFTQWSGSIEIGYFQDTFFIVHLFKRTSTEHNKFTGRLTFESRKLS